MEVRFESMVFLWDDKIPTMFLEFMNLLTLCQSEEQLRASVKDFAEKHELDKSNSPIYNDKIVMYNISYYTNYKSINNNQISTNLGAFFAFFKHRRSFKTP